MKFPPYYDHIWLTYMLIVLWKLPIWWAILSQYVDNILIFFWQYGEQYCQHIVTDAKAGDLDKHTHFNKNLFFGKQITSQNVYQTLSTS